MRNTTETLLLCLARLVNFLAFFFNYQETVFGRVLEKAIDAADCTKCCNESPFFALNYAGKWIRTKGFRIEGAQVYV